MERTCRIYNLLLCLFLTLISVRLIAEDSCDELLEVHTTFEESVEFLSEMYVGERYKDLDEHLNCLVYSSKRFTSGVTYPTAAYWFYRGILPAPIAGSDHKQKINQWIQQSGASPFSSFAMSRSYYSEGWTQRNAGDFDKYYDLLRQGEEHLTAHKDLAGTPIYYSLLLAIALDSRQAKNKYGKVFHEAQTKWPSHFDFHETYLTRLVPRWYGSWEEVENFIKYWSKYHEAAEGKSVYARLYNSLAKNGFNLAETKIDRVRYRTSLVDLLNRYPDSMTILISAWPVCQLQDQESISFVEAVIKKRSSTDPILMQLGSDINLCDD